VARHGVSGGSATSDGCGQLGPVAGTPQDTVSDAAGKVEEGEDGSTK